ncbi:MAG TPA: hypothetical protein VKZ53_14925, partial [Candidatus Angelobacter sp.]|nr:hypothetical protein [Candidatus Angelobacter sp.]
MPRIALLSPSDTVTNIDPLISGLKRLRVALSALPSLPSLGRLAFQSLWVWLFLLPSCAISGFGSVTIDANVSADLSSAATQVTTPAFSTASGHELLLAFVAGDGSVPGMTSTVTGAGLNWVLVARANSAGTAEIWRAFSFLPLSNVTVTANLGQSGIASLQVVSFSGVDSSGIDGS